MSFSNPFKMTDKSPTTLSQAKRRLGGQPPSGKAQRVLGLPSEATSDEQKPKPTLRQRFSSAMSTARKRASSAFSAVSGGLSRGMSSLGAMGSRAWKGFNRRLGQFKLRVQSMEKMLRSAVIALAALLATFLLIQWMIHLFSFWMGLYLPILVQWYYIPISMTAGILVSKNVVKQKDTKGMYLLAFVMSIISLWSLSIQISEISRSNSPTWQHVATKCTGSSCPKSYTPGVGESPFDHYPIADTLSCPNSPPRLVETWRPAYCPCLSEDDVDYLHDLQEDFHDADEEDKRDDFGNRDSFLLVVDQECFLHPLYDGSIVLTKGLSRENIGGQDNGLLVVTHNAHSFADFNSKHIALLALDITNLVLLVINLILSGLILWVWKPDDSTEKTGPLDRSEPLTRAQMMGKYTSYVLMVLYAVTALVGFLAYVEGYYLHLRLQLLLFIPTLTVGLLLEVPAKRARAGVEYFNHLRVLLHLKDVQSRHQKMRHEMTQEELNELKTYRDNDKIDDKLEKMEQMVPKYRELYGAASPAFNLSFVASVMTMVVGIYALVEHELENERYGSSYLEKMSESGVRTIPNGDTLLWVELPDSVSGDYLAGLYHFAWVVHLLTVLGGILLTASCGWRLAQSVRNWKRLSQNFDIEDIGGGSHDEMLAELFEGMSETEVTTLYQESAPDFAKSGMSFSLVHQQRRNAV